jgi:hypothetical protein
VGLPPLNDLAEITFRRCRLLAPSGLPGVVPEPSTWAMLLLGFAGLLGLSQDEDERGGVVNRGARDEAKQRNKEAPSKNA